MLETRAPNDTIYYKLYIHTYIYIYIINIQTQKAIVQFMYSHIIHHVHVLIYEISKCILLGET